MNKAKTEENSLSTEVVIYQTSDGLIKLDVKLSDNTVWLTIDQLAELFKKSRSTINEHILNIYAEEELSETTTKRKIGNSDFSTKPTNYYNLEMIIAVGYRVHSRQGTLFRQWATELLREYLTKGFVIDDDRLKKPSGSFDYFDELLARIRDIRASELRFYQKIKDLFKLSSDYDASDKSTQQFFAETQNKLLYAVTQQTAAELITARADANLPNMGLMSWKGTKVRKEDIFIAKNYLNAQEIDQLNRLTVIFLETAELRVQERQDLTIEYWRNTVDKLLSFQEKPLLTGAGSISHKQMEVLMEKQYSSFDTQRKQQELAARDMDETIELEKLTAKLKRQKNDK